MNIYEQLHLEHSKLIQMQFKELQSEQFQFEQSLQTNVIQTVSFEQLLQTIAIQRVSI
jgi:hypothetical protein